MCDCTPDYVCQSHARQYRRLIERAEAQRAPGDGGLAAVLVTGYGTGANPEAVLMPNRWDLHQVIGPSEEHRGDDIERGAEVAIKALAARIPPMTTLVDALTKAIHAFHVSTPVGCIHGRQVQYDDGVRTRDACEALACEYIDTGHLAAYAKDCPHVCEGGHFDGDAMVMNEMRGWSLRDRGLELDGVTPVALSAIPPAPPSAGASEELEALAVALDKYGTHQGICPAYHDFDAACTCGWDDVMIPMVGAAVEGVPLAPAILAALGPSAQEGASGE